MMTRLNQSFEQIRQFSTDVSHELRTPLTVVRGQLEVALFTAETVEQYRDAMVNALEGVERLSNIVRALLMLSQAESGQLALQKTRARSGRAGARFGGSVPDSGRSAGRPALRDAARRTALISADRIQIERLLSNLLGNAIKYTPAGGLVKVSLIPGLDHVKLHRGRHRRGNLAGASAAHFRPLLSRAFRRR